MEAAIFSGSLFSYLSWVMEAVAAVDAEVLSVAVVETADVAEMITTVSLFSFCSSVAAGVMVPAAKPA